MRILRMILRKQLNLEVEGQIAFLEIHKIHRFQSLLLKNNFHKLSRTLLKE